ncbi:hypothetical protein GMRT_14850 [Giardia muris]|uniref:Uncharacterized protein n=1 Tax=Giardia muris TaxID=5742 RepID=A0A4Z1SKQ5_GIAMU|nr:hypothetical protein GMRT_14850 [Giardia muris]|eukprot:TNJ26226.1 hypothetical protein GMRT_14850 [Giardia muris]
MFSLALLALITGHRVLLNHTGFPLSDEPPKRAVKQVAELIARADIPIPHTAPSVLVIPGYQDGLSTDRGIAASYRTIVNRIEDYSTVIIVGGYFPEACGVSQPLLPISAYSGERVRTALGDFEVDRALAQRFIEHAGDEAVGSFDHLIEQSDFFDQPLFWLRALFPLGKTPKVKVLPMMLYALYRNQVQVAAQILNDVLFRPMDGSTTYGISSTGERYLVVIPITVSSGLSLFNNIYIENVLSDITARSAVIDFENWLYYLSSLPNVQFSKTIASQILVVHLAALAALQTQSQVTRPALQPVNATEPYWRWLMLEYYTSFDERMNRQKMIESEYYHTRVSGIDVSQFTPEDDPLGEKIYYSMALSLEPPYQTVTHKDEKKGKTRITQLHASTPVTLTDNFSPQSLQQLMRHVQGALRGEKVSTDPGSLAKLNLPPELQRIAPYAIRVYVLAEHDAEYSELKRAEKMAKKAKKGKGKNNTTPTQSATGVSGSDALMCPETILFEVQKSDFFPTKGLFESLVEQAAIFYNEHLSPARIDTFLKGLKKTYGEKIARGELPPLALKNIPINIKDSLVVEISIYHSWEYRNIFTLRDAKGHFISLWDGRYAVCEVPETPPDNSIAIFFRLTQCSLRGGLGPWDWQRGLVHTYDRTRYTTNVYPSRHKDEL